MHDDHSFEHDNPEAVLDAWDAVRQRQARHRGPTIEAARPMGFWRRYADNWRKAPLHVCMIAIFLGGFVLPWSILIGGFVLLAVYDAIVRAFA